MVVHGTPSSRLAIDFVPPQLACMNRCFSRYPERQSLWEEGQTLQYLLESLDGLMLRRHKPLAGSWQVAAVAGGWLVLTWAEL